MKKPTNGRVQSGLEYRIQRWIASGPERSIPALAARIGTSYRSIYRWQRGEAVLPITMAVALSSVLGCEIREIAEDVAGKEFMEGWDR